MNFGTLHEGGVLTKNTQKIFTLLGESFETLAQANSFSQQHLLRTGERWDQQEETPVFQKCIQHKDALMNHLKVLGMVDAVYPAKKQFHYALCMGALAGRVQQRLDFIADLQDDGYTFDTIVLLGGARPLRESEKLMVLESIETEAHMMQYLYDNHARIEKTKLMCVDVPMIQKDDGSTRRPNTDDTLNFFSEMASGDGDCLVVSNNPYLLRQAKVTQRILDQERFPTYGAGTALDDKKVDILIAMDELARAIYEEYRASK